MPPVLYLLVGGLDGLGGHQLSRTPLFGVSVFAFALVLPVLFLVPHVLLLHLLAFFLCLLH